MGIEGAFSCSLVQHGRAGSLFASIGWSYRVRCHRDQGLRPDSPGGRPGRRSLGPCGRLSQVGNRHRNAPSVRSNPWPPCRKVEERGGRAESRYRGRRLTITPHDINSIENPSSRTDPTFAGGRSCNAAVDAGEAKTPVRRGRRPDSWTRSAIGGPDPRFRASDVRTGRGSPGVRRVRYPRCRRRIRGN